MNNLLSDVYEKSKVETEKNLVLWENYLQQLKALDFNVYSDKLVVPALVPVGNKVLFRGELRHTNEVTAALGADYFVKCSVKQAEVLRQHRIKAAEEKVAIYTKEKEYLEDQILNKLNFIETVGQELVEVHTEEEDKAWREKHRENVKKYKQGESKERQEDNNKIDDEELWNRLEELELQEELENELNDADSNGKNTFVVKEESIILKNYEDNTLEIDTKVKDETKGDEIVHKDNEHVPIDLSSQYKLDVLESVIQKQQELVNKLTELKERQKVVTTESELIVKLEEMDELDELEDEINRIDDILQTNHTDDQDSDSNTDDSSTKSNSSKLKKSITFADEDESETLELTFKHTDVQPNDEPYDPENGITKPSDIYEAYFNLFDNKTSSILKKSKYGTDTATESDIKIVNSNQVEIMPTIQNEIALENGIRTIIVKDVVEKTVDQSKTLETKARPTSLFKKKRLQNKT